MSAEDQSAPKLLLVVTAPFGELFCAAYLVMGCGFRTVFALIDRLFSFNHAVLPGKSLRYENLSDLLAIIDEEEPDIVCLFSGYLCVSDGIMDFEELDRLIDHISSRGIKVVTSDPFLGFASRVPTFDHQNLFEQFLTIPVRLVGELMFGNWFPYFARVSSSLKRVPHLYVVDPDEPGDIKRLAFFNPHMRRYVSELHPRGQKRPITNTTAMNQPYWLFILANSEYGPQIKQRGATGFHELLAQKFRETIAEGRQPVLIAPKPCLEALAAYASLNQCVFIENCDYEHYMSLLIGAEYVFYWNIFSASVIARMLNSLPTFFFARGHVADANPLMFEKGMSRYYANGRLSYLDQTSRLNRKELVSQAALQEAQVFTPFYENVRHLPTPGMVIHQLLED